MTSPASGSEPQPPTERSSAFDRLHPGVRRWVWDQRWPGLREVQQSAAAPILATDRDVIVAAATAGGKTEAAWLPIVSVLAEAEATAGVAALAVSPLKALINDQHDRLSNLASYVDIPVHRWHGDVPAARKREVVRNPAGVLLITPESLESVLVNHGAHAARIFAALRFVVIDELHAFLGTERGAQLQSLLHRVELVLRRSVPRIGLSATLGDFGAARDYLRPGRGDAVTLVRSEHDSSELRLQIRGYVTTDPQRAARDDDGEDQDAAENAIADHLFGVLRGQDNLVFANSRDRVESYADSLAQRAAAQRVPNEFLPHHGNLSKELREHAEARLKDPATPTTALCTSTLELGIDIGSVDTVAQIGAPSSVASLRQQLGRSGRRGDNPAVLRVYVPVPELTDRTPPLDALRVELIQSVAVTELLLERWLEPPDTGGLHLSTLVQQILSVTAQYGGAQPVQLFGALCGHGPFARIDRRSFAALLRALGAAELLQQGADGLLLPGPVGDRLVNHYSFYTAFQTPDEYRLVTNSRTLGSYPLQHPVAPGLLLIFGGRRWRVTSVLPEQRTIEVVPASGGRPPRFGGRGPMVADGVRRRMRELYEGDAVPAYLDATARTLLAQGRDAYRRFELREQPILRSGSETHVFCFRGDRIVDTVAAGLIGRGVDVAPDGLALTVSKVSPAQVWDVLCELAASAAHDPVVLAAAVPGKDAEKYDRYLSEDLLNVGYAARTFDVPAAWEALRHLAGRPRPPDSALPPTEPPAAVAQPPRRLSRRVTDGYAVVDVETTGLRPSWHDRVIEVGVVQVDRTGAVTDEWSTLVNPRRDLGPQHVHGITAAEVRRAPTFEEIAAALAERLGGRVLVAHNLPFDRMFLAAEYQRLGVTVPLAENLGVCTMRWAGAFLANGTGRSLHACCLAAGLRLQHAHSALHDARAAAGLLSYYLERAGTPEPWVQSFDSTRAWPVLPPSRRGAVTRSATVEPPSHFLSRITDRMPRVPDPPQADSYLAVLDGALLDRHLSISEQDALVELASALGLDRRDLDGLHRSYLAAMARVAWSDGHVSEDERSDLLVVADLLGIAHTDGVQILDRRGGEAVPMFRLTAGDTVVFTGQMREPREVWECRARDAGLVATGCGVTKGTSLVVAADPDSLSGKAAKARDYGIPIVTEDGFARLLHDLRQR